MKQGMDGRMMKRCGHSFKSCSKIRVHMIHLAGKLIHYGTKIYYILLELHNSLISRNLWQNVWFFNKNKVETVNTPGLLQPLAIPSRRWEEASMDFIMGLLKSKGKSFIVVVVDRITKYAQFCALSHPFKANTVATTFLETMKKLYVNLRIIVSEKDPFSLKII